MRLFAAVIALLPAAALGAELTVVVTELAHASAPVRVAVFADAPSFAARAGAVAQMVLIPRDGTARAVIGRLPPGRYAAAVFQDLNGNGSLDTNLFGFPTEPWAFSGEAGAYGPPSFAQASFPVSEPTAGITVRLRR